MSERKVLNKYYPPDFDPSKIPRGKKGRNTTFTIRLMAPCNMRCTTCGEYIYKGRKFNSRKEDVDDMNHLGLRIYRFYIKCTACLSEISFRTDPANTDYVLEAGATRNFEALSKAEKQAELDQKAYQEEIKLNPMKLLEERTEASKNEMERMEALEELHELNKRNLKNELPDEMLAKYQKLKEPDVDEVEKQDEEFIKTVFGKDTNNQTIKRIIEEDDDNEIEPISTKQQKLDRPTDLLSNTKLEKDQKNTWEKSIGSLNNKNKLKGLIVKRKADQPSKSSINSQKTDIETSRIADSSSNLSSPSISSSSSVSSSNILTTSSNKNVDETKNLNPLGSLGLDYSDTDSE